MDPLTSRLLLYLGGILYVAYLFGRIRRNRDKLTPDFMTAAYGLCGGFWLLAGSRLLSNLLPPSSTVGMVLTAAFVLGLIVASASIVSMLRAIRKR